MSKSLVTLKSSLESHDISALASVLAKMGGEKAAVQKFGLTFSLAVKEAQNVLKKQEAEKEQNRQAAAEKRQATIEARHAEQETVAQDRRVEAENLLKNLVDEMGLDLEVAQEMVSSAMAKKYPVKKDVSFKFNRVSLDYNGESYDMPTSGNMPQVWKDRVQDENDGDRAAFILAYAVDQEAAKEVLEQKNGVNV